MTKLVHCRICGDMLTPFRQPRAVRRCRCEAIAFWWEAPERGELRIWAHPLVTRVPGHADVTVIGLHNALFDRGSDWIKHRRTTKELVTALLALTPANYLFKQVNSLVVHFEIGVTGDVQWADALPESPG